MIHKAIHKFLLPSLNYNTYVRKVKISVQAVLECRSWRMVGLHMHDVRQTVRLKQYNSSNLRIS